MLFWNWEKHERRGSELVRSKFQLHLHGQSVEFTFSSCGQFILDYFLAPQLHLIQYFPYLTQA